MDSLTPEQIEALGKAAVGVVAAMGAIVATVASVITAYWTYRTRRDTHYLGDKIRATRGEPLQYRYDPERRNVARAEQEVDAFMSREQIPLRESLKKKVSKLRGESNHDDE